MAIAIFALLLIVIFYFAVKIAEEKEDESGFLESSCDTWQGAHCTRPLSKRDNYSLSPYSVFLSTLATDLFFVWFYIG